MRQVMHLPLLIFCFRLNFNVWLVSWLFCNILDHHSIILGLYHLPCRYWLILKKINILQILCALINCRAHPNTFIFLASGSQVSNVLQLSSYKLGPHFALSTESEPVFDFSFSFLILGNTRTFCFGGSQNSEGLTQLGLSFLSFCIVSYILIELSPSMGNGP